MLHLTNGDAAAEPLRRAGLTGHVIVWSDVLHEGPTPAEHGEVWRQVRAKFISGCGYAPFDDVLRRHARADAALDRYRDQDELVLWFEHDLFDQLLIARHLHWLGTQGHVGTKLSLVCIDRFPGVVPFHGLGQLTPSQIATLFPLRQPITAAMLRAGADVWRAFTDSDPRALAAIVRFGIEELPFMAGALRRHLEEFPGKDGLSRTQRTVLQELSARARTPAELFRAVADREERVFMGDSTFWRIVREMADPPEPLVAIDVIQSDDEGLPDGAVSLAAAGDRVLRGKADAIALRGINRWLGGVHLQPDVLWRWDPIAGKFER